MPADLVEFLRARLVDDEHVAKGVASSGVEPWELMEIGDSAGFGSVCIDSARVLAEVAAKRAIVDACEAAAQRASGLLDIDVLGARISTELFGQAILRLLAQPFASHPDYDPAWNTQTQEA